ncbi:HAMP domain-containing protein, partial [Fulvimarina manganoxydans]
MSLTISRKLGLILLFAGLLSLALSTYQAFEAKTLITDERRELLKSEVETAVSIANHFYDLVAAGTMSEEAAKAVAIEAIGSIRYGKGDYFFATDLDATMLMNANRTLIGKNFLSVEDKNGVKLFQQLIGQAKSGGGFTSFLWPRSPDTAPVDKLAYSASPKWNWMIGTGVYTDDIDALFTTELLKSATAFFVFMLTLIAIGWPLARSISEPIKAMTGVMRRIAAGDTELSIPGRGRRDEIGEMAETVEIFKQSQIERDRLARLAEETRQNEVLAKERQAAIESAKAEDLRVLVTAVESSFDRLSDGDLTIRMNQKLAPEFEPIRVKFNDSVSQLEAAIGGVVSSVQTIRT